MRLNETIEDPGTPAAMPWPTPVTTRSAFRIGSAIDPKRLVPHLHRSVPGIQMVVRLRGWLAVSPIPKAPATIKTLCAPRLIRPADTIAGEAAERRMRIVCAALFVPEAPARSRPCRHAVEAACRLVIYFGTTAVTSISKSMPGIASALMTKKVFAGIGPSPYASLRHLPTSAWKRMSVT
jgi:hypothetical protein